MTNPPVTQKRSHPLVFTNNQRRHERHDDYYWLRDDERKSEAVLTHLANENAYTQTTLAHTETLQESLFEEMIGRFAQDEASVPHKRGDYWYVSRFAGQEFQQHWRKPQRTARKRLVLDENAQQKAEIFLVPIGVFAR